MSTFLAPPYLIYLPQTPGLDTPLITVAVDPLP